MCRGKGFWIYNIVHGTFCTSFCCKCTHLFRRVCTICVWLCVWLCEWAEALYTRVYFCTIVRVFCTVLRSFCTVLRSSRGKGRDAALLHPPASCQLETIPCNSVQFYSWWVALVDGGDVTGTRQPGWMRLQTRPFAVGANLPKHWRDGQSLISFDVKASEVLWVPRNRLISQVCQTKAVSADQRSA